LAKLRFRGRLVRIDQYVCLILPHDVAAPFGDGYRVPIKGTINGYGVRTSVFRTRDGDRMMIVNKDMQKGATVGLDDSVDVLLEIDHDRRQVTVPPDLAKALARARAAKAAFDRIPCSHQQRYVSWIDEAKRPETRSRRIAETVNRLLTTDTNRRRTANAR
jgi:hypothetical protein